MKMTEWIPLTVYPFVLTKYSNFRTAAVIGHGVAIFRLSIVGSFNHHELFYYSAATD